MHLKDLRLSIAQVTDEPSKQTLKVVSCRLDTDKNSVIVGVRLEVCTRRNSRNPVKLPLTDENKTSMAQVEKLLKRNDYVTVLLKEPVVMAYALISNGSLIQGVSIKADSFDIVESDEDLLGD